MGHRRRIARVVIAGSIVCAPAVALLASAEAHPLGNATVSHYDGLTLSLDHIDNFAVEDTAEIPTVGRESSIDTDGNKTLSDAERAAYATAQCASLADGVHLSVGGRAATWSIVSSDYAQRPGAAGLAIGRLECRLSTAVDLKTATTVSVDDSWDGAGVGWHEITAVGNGISLTNSPVPASSVSETLLKYPNDMLSSPLDVRMATLQVSPGGGGSTYQTAKPGSQANWAVRKVSELTTQLNDLVKGRLDIGVGALAVLLSVLLGAGHAMLPGHGKTIMAAYLVGKRGRLRDVVTVGATVTITHTAGVLILGTLISLSATFAPTAVEQSLGVISGAIVVMVGIGLLVSASRRRAIAGSTVDASIAVVEQMDPTFVVAGHATQALAVGGESRTSVATITSSSRSHVDASQEHTAHNHDHAAHDHDHAAHDHAAHDHAAHDHAAHAHAAHAHAVHAHGESGAAQSETHAHGWFSGGHSHGPGSDHSHDPSEGFSRRGLIGLGAAGGLVPSPSALLVLLATIALGRTAFGVLLVLAYGLGMAGALTLAGLLLVKFRNHIASYGAGRFRRLGRIAAVLPILTATLVIIVGLGLAARSLGGNL